MYIIQNLEQHSSLSSTLYFVPKHAGFLYQHAMHVLLTASSRQPPLNAMQPTSLLPASPPSTRDLCFTASSTRGLNREPTWGSPIRSSDTTPPACTSAAVEWTISGLGKASSFCMASCNSGTWQSRAAWNTDRYSLQLGTTPVKISQCRTIKRTSESSTWFLQVIRF